jgi:hypothetical protein
MLLFSDEIIEFVPAEKNGTIKSRTLKTYFTLRNVLSAWLYAGIFTGLLLYRLGWGVLFTQCAVALCLDSEKQIFFLIFYV